MLSRPITVASAVGMTFTLTACPWGTPVEEDGYQDVDYCDNYGCCSGTCTPYYTEPTTLTPLTTEPYNTIEYCSDYGCCGEYGCYEESYYPTTYYTSEPPPTDPTVTTIPDTDTIFTSTTETETFTDTEIFTDTDTDTSTASTDTDTTTTGTDTTGTSTDTDTSTSTGDTDTDTDTDTSTGGDEAFPPLGVFGDDVIELDLVGTWSLQWAPDGATFDSVITIDSNGEFIWRETSADCTTDNLGTGVLWVEPGQLVLHVDTWERQLPWDTLPVMGQEFPPPFRMRMSYALLGANLMLAATDRVTEIEPYTGRAYIQAAAAGVFIAGQWIGETELLAVVFGEQQAKVIVRDRFIADLDVEPGLDPESTGVITHDQTFYGVDPPIANPPLFEGGNWTCLDGCPQPAGATLINGGNLFAYGPYAGFQRLATFASGRTFRRDIDTDCP
jgi:hypothetical protein